MKVHFLDVGHGDMTLFDFNGVFVLIDCNISDIKDKAYKYLDKQIPKPNDDKKKKRIDYLIITHPDEDHIKGLDLVKDKFEIGQIWESGFRRSEDAEESPEYDKLLEIISELGSKQLKAGSNKISFSVDGVEVYCLCSKSNDDDDPHYNGLVLKFIEDEKSVIFAGDSSCEAWKNKIVKNYSSLLNADILHASHHGSRTFFYEKGQDYEQDDPYVEGIEDISPTHTIVSACDPEEKKDETWPPHEDAIKLYEEYTSNKGGVYMTGSEGNLVFDISETGITLIESMSSTNYKFFKGRYQKYSPLKAPFVSTKSEPEGKVIKNSFG